VLPATVYSKSVLRAAVGEVYDRYDHVDYFPSYEIITGAYNRGAYFGSDLRSVEEAGVFHVMKLMFKHYLGRELRPEDAPRPDSGATSSSPPQASEHSALGNTMSSYVAQVVCEEELLLR
jgi:hypothetical protein